MISEVRKQSMPWMETDYSKHTPFRWKIKWRLEHLGVLGIMDETAPLMNTESRAASPIILSAPKTAAAILSSIESS